MPETPDAPDSVTTTTATVTRAEDLAARLRRVLPADAVLSGAECARFAVAGRAPLAVVMPRDVEGVGAALAVAAETHAAVVPWGGGTRQALGCLPTRYDLALSLARLDAVLDHDSAALTVTVQAGITHAVLARRLATAGQMLPLDVARPRAATIGGTLACDTLGPRQNCYGGVRALTLGLRALAFARGQPAVDGEGRDGSVPPDGAGQLQIGALGTLGVIVEARLKLAALPETETTLLGIFGSLAEALEMVPALASLAPRPTALCVVRAGALSPLAHLAPMHGGRALLAARLSGSIAEVARAAQGGRAILRRAGARTILSVEAELQDAFWGPVVDFTQTASHQPSEVLLRVTAAPGETAGIMRQAAEIAAAHDLGAAELADALSGTVWLRLRPRAQREEADANAGTDRPHLLARGLSEMCAGLRRRWPRTVILDGPAELAGELDVWGAPPQPATSARLRAARQRLDPTGLLNPGRYPL